MGRKAKFSKEIKLKAINDYKSGHKSMINIAFDLGCNESTVRTWINLYNSIGESAFDNKPRNKSYSKELKATAINDYLEGYGSLRDIAKKYNIYSYVTLRNWIMMYNSHKEIKDYNPRGDVYMTKSRKTTYEEKLETVQFCLDNDKSYTLTAEKFDQPYTQVYQWVNKFLEQGADGLLDRRGRTKQESELSETEKLKRENERLQVKNERLQMENEVLKKQEEIERRLSLARSGKKRNI